MESYRSGHNEAVLKTVWANAHVGSNPTLSAKKRTVILRDGCSFLQVTKGKICRKFEILIQFLLTMYISINIIAW